ncbi:MAG: hypothetical protein ACKO5C_04600 [Ferruginibacter sp.]
MKKYLIIVLTAFLLVSCGSKKGFLERENSDRALQDAVKKLRKDPDNEEAKTAIPQLYKVIRQKHLDKINAYSSSTLPNKWELLLGEYQLLQDAYDAIINSPTAFQLVTPESYSAKILDIKDAGAAEAYNLGQSFLERGGRENAKKAYNAFQKSGTFIPGYKDINDKMQAAYDAAIVRVIIETTHTSANVGGNVFGNAGNNVSNEFFQQNLIRDLPTSNLAAKFFTPSEARRMNIITDWTIQFNLKSLSIPDPTNTYSTRSVNKQIQIGTDTAGRPVYNTVYATLQTTLSKCEANATVEMTIRQVNTSANISNRLFTDRYTWQQSIATFAGDRRALSDQDWELINNSGINAPRKQDIQIELYRKAYPSILREVQRQLAW